MGDEVVEWGRLAVAALVSAIVAYVSIDFFMRFVSRIGLMPFAIYQARTRRGHPVCAGLESHFYCYCRRTPGGQEST